MKHLDYENLLLRYHQKYKKNLFVLIILLVLFVALFVLGILLSTYENRVTVMVIFSIALALLSTFIIGFLVFGVLEYRNQEKQLNYILGGYLTIVEGKIIKIKDIFTSISGRKGIEIVVGDEEVEINVLFDPYFGDIPFKEEEEVQLQISESFVVDYEVKNG